MDTEKIIGKIIDSPHELTDSELEAITTNEELRRLYAEVSRTKLAARYENQTETRAKVLHPRRWAIAASAIGAILIATAAVLFPRYGEFRIPHEDDSAVQEPADHSEAPVTLGEIPVNETVAASKVFDGETLS